MKQFCTFFGLFILWAGCSEPPPATRTTPEGAFARLVPCIDNARTDCLLGELDKDSRDSMYNLYAILKEMKSLVASSYPQDPAVRESAFGPWNRVAEGNTAAEMFSLYCAQRDCMGTLASGFGVISTIKRTDPSTVEVTTMRDGVFTLHSVNGEWGLATYRTELMAEAARMRRAVSEVRKNAAEYQEQRRATGSAR